MVEPLELDGCSESAQEATTETCSVDQEQKAPAQGWPGWGRANDRGGGWGQQRHKGGGKCRQPARAYAPAHDPRSREMPRILQRIRATGDPTYSDVRCAAPHKTLGMEHAVKKRRKSQTFD
jgi:hypothetical protein